MKHSVRDRLGDKHPETGCSAALAIKMLGVGVCMGWIAWECSDQWSWDKQSRLLPVTPERVYDSHNEEGRPAAKHDRPNPYLSYLTALVSLRWLLTARPAPCMGAHALRLSVTLTPVLADIHSWQDQIDHPLAPMAGRPPLPTPRASALSAETRFGSDAVIIPASRFILHSHRGVNGRALVTHCQVTRISPDTTVKRGMRLQLIRPLHFRSCSLRVAPADTPRLW